MDFNLHRRISRWIFAFLGICLLMVMLCWLVGLRFQTSPWDYHVSRLQAGKQKGSMMLGADVWLLRTRSAIGLHHRDGSPIVQGVIKRIGYDKAKPDTLLVAFSTSAYPYSTLGDSARVAARPDYLMAQVDLQTSAATCIKDEKGLHDETLMPIETFFPYRAEDDPTP